MDLGSYQLEDCRATKPLWASEHSPVRCGYNKHLAGQREWWESYTENDKARVWNTDDFQYGTATVSSKFLTSRRKKRRLLADGSGRPSGHRTGGAGQQIAMLKTQ